jgi:hypothetical protein
MTTDSELQSNLLAIALQFDSYVTAEAHRQQPGDEKVARLLATWQDAYWIAYNGGDRRIADTELRSLYAHFNQPNNQQN